MCDTKSILKAAEKLDRDRVPYFIATVVCVDGSSYRKPGARMLLTADQWVAGSVSGGCLERDVVRKSSWLTRDDEAHLVTYDASDPDEVGALLGCNGVVHVLVERIGGPSDPLRFMRRCMERQERGAIVTVFRSEAKGVFASARMLVDRSGWSESSGLNPRLERHFEDLGEECIRTSRSRVTRVESEDGFVDVLVESIVPPPRLFVFGTGHDTIPVVSMALDLGWDVSVFQPSDRALTRERFGAHVDVISGDIAQALERIESSDRAACVVMSHNVEYDRAALKGALSTHAFYIGALGPRKRALKLLAESDLEDAIDDPRLCAPIGLALGAETPEEIALSIIAEIQSKLADANAQSLRGHEGSIHACAAE